MVKSHERRHNTGESFKTKGETGRFGKILLSAVKVFEFEGECLTVISDSKTIHPNSRKEPFKLRCIRYRVSKSLASSSLPSSLVLWIY
jgi:hypothetical protein